MTRKFIFAEPVMMANVMRDTVVAVIGITETQAVQEGCLSNKLERRAQSEDSEREQRVPLKDCVTEIATILRLSF